ncbi:MAG: PDZ domain-containing protein, partial [Candidatus Eremiobacteraeota bacterium]|nr:PDZ domain-containing protein [Candidatus Eremiobacteraeota bacterium]
MSFKLRAAFAVLVLVIATAGGAAYVANSGERAGAAGALVDHFPSLALREIEATAGGNDLALIDQAYARVEDVYYRPVDLQRLLDGSRQGLTGYLHAQKAGFRAPAMTTTGTRQGDVALVRREVETLASRDSKLNQSDLTRAAITGMLRSLDDPYTVYLSAREITALNEELQGGDFGGIGVYIVQDRKTRETIVAPIPDNPAIVAGVKPGDIVVAVDGVTAAGRPLDDVERRIRGQIGTRVTLVLRNPKSKAERSVTITRARVHVPSAISKLDRGVEYVRLGDFGTTSYAEVRKAMLDGKAHGAKGYVLDL